MTFEEAIATQPAWLGYWLNGLLIGAFVLPVTLLIWRQSRLAGIVTLLASGISAVLVTWIYGQMGYVKLLGLPHILFWTPVAIYLLGQIRRPEMPVWPARIMVVILATITISLIFDYVDVARYLLGETTPVPGTAPGG